MATYTMNKTFISSKRILVRYDEDGGRDKEGIIEIRPGVSDISIGERYYAQIAIAIDSRWYIRGMAIYANDIPDGYDVVYYTKKPRGTPLKRRRSFPYGMDGRVFKYVSKHMPFHFMDNPMLILIDKETAWGEWQKGLSANIAFPMTDFSKNKIPPGWASNILDARLSLNIALTKMRLSPYAVLHPDEYEALLDIYNKLKYLQEGE